MRYVALISIHIYSLYQGIIVINCYYSIADVGGLHHVQDVSINIAQI